MNKKILINGYYGFGNLGDDLLVLFFYRIIKKHLPNDEIYLFSNASSNNNDFKLKGNYNNYLVNLTGIQKLNIIDWTYKEKFDIVINGGGGTFFDYSKASTQKRIINKIVSIFNPKTVFTFEQFLRKILKKESNIQFEKNFAIGNNVGPFDTNSNRFIQLYSKVGSIDSFLVRDNDSEIFLKKFNYKGHYEKIYDVVFSKSYFPEIKGKIPTSSIKTVGIVLMNWENKGKEYLAKFDELKGKLLEQNIETKYFAFSGLDDEILKSYTNNEINIWKPNEMNLETYLKEFSKIDLCVSMRFHGLVIANCMNIPSIGIGINNKIIDYVLQTKNTNEQIERNFEINVIKELILNINKKYQKSIDFCKNYKNEFQKTETIVENFIKRNIL